MVLEKFTSFFTGNYKYIILLVVVIIIFIVASVYTYRRYAKAKINPSYIANNEFLPEGANKQNEIADLYFFYTTWCPHCKKSMPIWQSLKSDLDNKEFKGVMLNFVEVDCDKDTALAEKYNVQGYPTIKLVRGNQVIEYDAKPSKDTLMEFLQTSL